MTKTQLLSLIIAVWLGIASVASALPDETIPTIPDFTKGASIPSEAKHD
jgi:hypothetical protein